MFHEEPYLVCHDYSDLEFARGFPETPCLYFDDVNLHIESLRTARFVVTYRLHAFLPCLAFGTPSIHLSYDERGREMVATAGMKDWDIDLIRERDVVAAVMQRVGNLERYRKLRSAAQATIRGLQATSDAALRRFAADVAARQPRECRPR
jgi:polysaccharide pyruvyl transferase WcaK-like protein